MKRNKYLGITRQKITICSNQKNRNISIDKKIRHIKRTLHNNSVTQTIAGPDRYNCIINTAKDTGAAIKEHNHSDTNTAKTID